MARNEQEDNVRNHLKALGAAWAVLAHAGLAGATTLEQAMEMAASQHPQTRIANLRVQAAGGMADEQAAYAHNPVIAAEPQRRALANGGHTNDYYLSLSQGIEIGGKRGYRREAAKTALEIARAEAEAARQQRMFDAAAAYVDFYYAERSLKLHQQVADMYRTIVAGMKRRSRVGENSRLDVNLTQAAYASSLNALTLARQAWNQRRAALATAIGREVAMPLTPLPSIASWPRPPTDWTRAWTQRPDMRAIRLRQREAEMRMKEASARRIPDIELSAMVGREAGDRLVKLGLSVPLPVLNAHQGAYRAAVADQERARAELEWRRQRLQFEVETALRDARETARAARAVLDSSIIEDSRAAIRLARKAWEAGELEPEDMVFRVRQAVNAIVSSLETLRLAWHARIRLARAFGQPDLIIQGVKP